MTLAIALIGAGTAFATVILLYLQVRGARAGADLTISLGVIVRLQEVLWEIADHPPSFAYVWSHEVTPAPVDNSREHAAICALIDVLSLALVAAERIPGFSQDGEDWASYADYVFRSYPNVRREAILHSDWWPEVTGHATRAGTDVQGLAE